MYALGIDLGTTYTAAATWRNGHAEVASLGSKAAVIPSVVLLRDDAQVLIGEAASRRGLTEPQRVAREFKRRFGDTTPIMLGGAPHSAEALTAKLLRSVIDDVAKREGGQPQRICISHPANWGPFKRELLDQVVRLANVTQPVKFTTEPEAAAAFYAHQQRIEPGAVVAVYDLGGGTFDATVLRKTAQGFEILGQPEGIERLGGIDFDAAVFNHVQQALDGKLEELDEDDPAVIAAVARLREECIEAKEALSSDTDTTIPVLLPNVSTEVRLTRAEFETMVRPALYSTIEALRRALNSAGVAPEQLHSVLLVGGSSRMPLVAQLVGGELGRPVAVDAHPKHAVALGAAWLAGGARPTAAAAKPPVVPPPAPPRRMTAPPPPPPPQRPAQRPPTAPMPVMAAAETPQRPPTPPRGQTAQRPDPVGPPPVGPKEEDDNGSGKWRRIGLVAAAAVLVAGGIGGVVWASSGGNDNEPRAGAQEKTTSPTKKLPLDEQCTDEIKANERWVCLTDARYVGKNLVVKYEADWAGGAPDINGGFHLHLYGSDGSDPAASIMGAHAGADRGKWVIKDEHPALLSPANIDEAIGDHPKVCARIANGDHELVEDEGGGYNTGNCVKIRGERPESGGEATGGPAPTNAPPNNPPPNPPPTTTTTTTTEPTTITTEPVPTPAGGEANPGAVPAEEGAVAEG